MARSKIEFDSYRFLAFVILHRDDRRLGRGMMSRLMLEPDVIIKFERECRNKDRVIPFTEFHDSCLSQPRTNSQRDHLNRHSQCVRVREEACQLFRTVHLRRDRSSVLHIPSFTSPKFPARRHLDWA